MPAPFRAVMLMLLAPALSLVAGCGDSTYYYMASDSAVPLRWRQDPRTRGWDGYAIRYELRPPDKVRAVVAERRPAGQSFEADGSYRFAPHPGALPYGEALTLYATFDGIEEAYRVYEMSSVFILLPRPGPSAFAPDRGED